MAAADALPPADGHAQAADLTLATFQVRLAERP